MALHHVHRTFMIKPRMLPMLKSPCSRWNSIFLLIGFIYLFIYFHLLPSSPNKISYIKKLLNKKVNKRERKHNHLLCSRRNIKIRTISKTSVKNDYSKVSSLICKWYGGRMQILFWILYGSVEPQRIANQAGTSYHTVDGQKEATRPPWIRNSSIFQRRKLKPRHV